MYFNEAWNVRGSECRGLERASMLRPLAQSASNPAHARGKTLLLVFFSLTEVISGRGFEAQAWGFRVRDFV